MRAPDRGAAYGANFRRHAVADRHTARYHFTGMQDLAVRRFLYVRHAERRVRGLDHAVVGGLPAALGVKRRFVKDQHTAHAVADRIGGLAVRGDGKDFARVAVISYPVKRDLTSAAKSRFPSTQPRPP